MSKTARILMTVIAVLSASAAADAADAADVIKADCSGTYVFRNPIVGYDNSPRQIDGIQLEIDVKKKQIIRSMDTGDRPGSKQFDPMDVYRITSVTDAIISFVGTYTKVAFITNGGVIDRTSGAFRYSTKRVDDGRHGMPAGDYRSDEQLTCSGFTKAAQQPPADASVSRAGSSGKVWPRGNVSAGSTRALLKQ